MVIRNHQIRSVVADGADPVLVKAVPALPDGGGSHFHLVEPGRALLIHQHLICGVPAAVVCQSKQNIRRSGEAGADAVIRAFGQGCEILCGVLLFTALQHVEIQRKNIACLEFFLQLSVSVGKDVPVGLCGLSADSAEFLCLLFVSQNLCDSCQGHAGVAKAGRGRPFAAALPLAHLGNIRSHPVTKMKHGRRIPDIFLFAEAEKSGPEAAGLHIFLHHGIIFFQKLYISSGTIFRPGNQDARIAPEIDGNRRHGGREAVALGRHRIGNAAGGQLLCLNVLQPFFKETAHVKIIAGRG